MSSAITGNNRITLDDLKLDPIATLVKKVTAIPQTTNVPTLTSKPVNDSLTTVTTKPDDFNKQVSFAGGKGQITANASSEAASSKVRPKNLNDIGTFTNTNLATAKDIDKILTRYNSPHAGKGQVILDACKKAGVNPIMMLAIMQEESQFGSTKLKPENQSNPFSVHFNHSAKGIAKLRHKDGSLPTFEESLAGGIRTVKKLAGTSATPLSTAGAKYSEIGNWSTKVQGHYKTLLTRY